MAGPPLHHSASFSLNRPGPQRLIAAVVLCGCFAAWCVQLGGTAALQAACPDDLHLELNNLDPLTAEATGLASAGAALRAALGAVNLTGLTSNIGKLQNASTPQDLVPVILDLVKSAGSIGQATAALGKVTALELQATAILASRSSAVFTLTPDDNCSDFYRYPWLNVALQLLVLVLAFYALATDILHTARVAICCLLTVSSVLAIENAHTFFYVRHHAPDLTLKRGKVFFAGCVGTCAANLLLLFILGIHNELEDGLSATKQTTYRAKEDEEDSKPAV
mmetsp:Transcript_38212/g.85141  ORF Transcript_38212/g.85141 Transcript_38212/m.85141 type:complete len:279 (+) Transcript_38212:113-949(+)